MYFCGQTCGPRLENERTMMPLLKLFLLWPVQVVGEIFPIPSIVSRESLKI